MVDGMTEATMVLRVHGTVKAEVDVRGVFEDAIRRAMAPVTDPGRGDAGVIAFRVPGEAPTGGWELDVDVRMPGNATKEEAADLAMARAGDASGPRRTSSGVTRASVPSRSGS